MKPVLTLHRAAHILKAHEKRPFLASPPTASSSDFFRDAAASAVVFTLVLLPSVHIGIAPTLQDHSACILDYNETLQLGARNLQLGRLCLLE